MITIITMEVGFIVSGSMMIEQIFNWDGMGLLVYRAIGGNDYPVLQGSLLVLTVCVVLANLLSDVLCALVDPRIQDGMAGMNRRRIFLRTWPLLLLLAVAVFAPVVAPGDPWEMTVPFLPPSAEHWLGTNDLGQDIFSELVFGTRTSLLVGFTASLVITVFGSFLGACAGYFGGWVDRVSMVFINVALAIPSLPLVIVLSAFLSRSVWNIILCICLTGWVGTARLVRTQTLRLRELGFIPTVRPWDAVPSTS